MFRSLKFLKSSRVLPIIFNPYKLSLLSGISPNTSVSVAAVIVTNSEYLKNYYPYFFTFSDIHYTAYKANKF